MTVEQAKNILDNKCSINECFEISGLNKGEFLTKQSSDSAYFGVMMMFAQVAHNFLVERGEISGDDIYPHKEKYWTGDIGFKADGLYRYYDNQWNKWQ